ncbi:unnamed protein product [Ascophyllum nodosum]
MERLTQTLKVDLPTQYDSPQDLSIFDDGVEFQDPVTRLCGKRRYRGMLFATLLFFRVACRPGSSYFKVLEIDSERRRTHYEARQRMGPIMGASSKAGHPIALVIYRQQWWHLATRASRKRKKKHQLCGPPFKRMESVIKSGT